jgi:hypothetical protein
MHGYSMVKYGIKTGRKTNCQKGIPMYRSFKRASPKVNYVPYKIDHKTKRILFKPK